VVAHPAGAALFVREVHILRLAWTLADLDGCAVPDEGHVSMAVLHRTGERVAA